jgi:hypothetical protein
MDALDGHNDPELAVDINDIAFSERAGDDFHGTYSLSLGRDSGRNIPILSP